MEKIESLLNKKRLHNRPVYNEYIKMKISSYNKRLIKRYLIKFIWLFRIGSKIYLLNRK